MQRPPAQRERGGARARPQPPPDVPPLPRMHDTSRSQQVDVRACYRCGRNAPRGRLAGGSSRVHIADGGVNETPAANRAVPTTQDIDCFLRDQISIDDYSAEKYTNEKVVGLRSLLN